MKEIKKILCAVDLSEHSKAVADYATLLAKGLGASVLVVYTAPSLSQYVGFHVPPNTIENFVGEIVTGAEKSMEAFVAENFPGVDAKGQVLIGYAAEEILNRAHEEKVDIIVMGTHGRKGIDRILFGSVAEKVVKNADMPVLTIRPTDPVTEQTNQCAACWPLPDPGERQRGPGTPHQTSSLQKPSRQRRLFLG